MQHLLQCTLSMLAQETLLTHVEEHQHGLAGSGSVLVGPVMCLRKLGRASLRPFCVLCVGVNSRFIDDYCAQNAYANDPGYSWVQECIAHTGVASSYFTRASCMPREDDCASQRKQYSIRLAADSPEPGSCDQARAFAWIFVLASACRSSCAGLCDIPACLPLVCCQKCVQAFINSMACISVPLFPDLLQGLENILQILSIQSGQKNP